jgi:4-hydroxy-2-oxoheptanedioate aldolase
MKNLKKRIKNGETVNGCWVNLGSPIAAELVGHAGFDWVLIDLEHSTMTEGDVLSILQAMALSPTAAIVRVESSDAARISKVMDAGAEGVMCPKINNAVEAKRVLNGLHYPPFGNRGVAKMVRATSFGKDFDEYYSQAKDNFLGVIQIETVEALNNLDEIAALEGVDVLFIGPSDLSMEMGIFGEFDNPIFIETIKKIVAAASKYGKATGILFFNPDDYKKYHDLGIKFIACGADATFVMNGAFDMVKKLNEGRQEKS